MITNTEILNKFSNLQGQLWSTVSGTVSESCGQTIKFTDPLTVASSANEIAAELSAPMLVIQFAFAGSPDKVQVILLSQDTFSELASELKHEKVEEIDDNLVVDLRAQLESIIQGICLSVGTIRQEPIVASGISIRYQLFQLPANLQGPDPIYRTQVAVSIGDVTGAMTWLVDAESAIHIMGNEAASEKEADTPFEQIQNEVTETTPLDESGSLGILMDIPLEISVELGRVKMLVRDVLELGSGSIVEIDKSAGEPVDVMVNGRLVARGEVVVIEDNFGVRITEICNAMERLNRLNDAA